jgi:predicted TIM-barrel fold metal-dependent hydrolase
MKLNFFDCNCMLGPWKKNKGTCFYKAEDLINFMDKNHISRCLAFYSLAKYGEIQTGNNKLLSEIKGQDRIVPCAIAMPHHSKEFPSPKDFSKYLLDNNIKAVRVFPKFHGVLLYSWLWEDLFYELEKNKIPIFIDFSVEGWSEEINWDQINDLCAMFPLLPIILVRMSLKTDRYIYCLFERHANLYLETSYYIVNNGIEKIVQNFGAKRLIFGTGIPVYNPNPPITMLSLADITEEQKEAIAYRNLEKLLKGDGFGG